MYYAAVFQSRVIDVVDVLEKPYYPPVIFDDETSIDVEVYPASESVEIGMLYINGQYGTRFDFLSQSQKRAESYATMTHKLDGTNLIDGELTVDSATNLLITHYIPQGLADKVTQTQTAIQNAKTYIKQIYPD